MDVVNWCINLALSHDHTDLIMMMSYISFHFRCIWEAVMDEMVLLNGKTLKKKSTSVRPSLHSLVPQSLWHNIIGIGCVIKLINP